MIVTDEQYKSMVKYLDSQWVNLLIKDKDNFQLLKEVFNNIKDDLNTEQLCPTINNIFNAFRLTWYSNVRVVIIGQDPYHTINEGHHIAHGLSFSSLDSKIPPSLRNIYQALINSKLMNDYPDHADLTYWASQGVLMLNKALTTMQGVPNKHQKYWKKYTNKIIQDISNRKAAEGVKLSFMLWGSAAQSCKEFINCHLLDNNNTINNTQQIKHEIYEWSHPSPMAQNRITQLEDKFINCGHFKKIAIEYKIDWDINHKVYIFTDGGGKTKNINCGGWAFHVINGLYDEYVEYGSFCDDRPTNQRAEAYALYKALQFINRQKITCDIILVTDLLNNKKLVEEWMHNWHAFDESLTYKTDGQPIQNVDIIRKIYALYMKITQCINIGIIHYESHQKPPADHTSTEYLLWYGNHVADLYASKGRDEVPEGESIVSTVE